MRPWGRTAAQAAAVAALAAALTLVVFRFSPRPPLHDFFDLRIYRAAAREELAGRPPYALRVGVGRYGFAYPPFALFALLPTALVGLRTAAVLSVALSGALAVALTCRLVVPLARRHGWSPWWASALAVPVVLAMEPIRETIGYGQINLAVFALLLADAAALRRGRREAGVGIGLATALKLTPGLFVVLLLATRRTRAAGVAAGTFAAASALALAVDPPTSEQFWAHALWAGDRVGRPANPNNASLLGMASRALGEGTPARLVWAAAALVVLAVGLRRAVRAHAAGDELAAFTLTGLTASLVSPVSWNHHLYWVVPAAVVLVDLAAGRDRPRAARVGAGFAAVAVVAGLVFSVQWLGRPPPLSVPRTGAGAVLDDTYGLLVLGLLLALPARRRPQDGQRGGTFRSAKDSATST